MTERERLVKLLAKSPARFCNGCNEVPEERAESIEKLADYLIASDVVDVVRCKDCTDCEHCYPRKDKGGEAIEGYYCYYHKRWVTASYYCGDGKRREG